MSNEVPMVARKVVTGTGPVWVLYAYECEFARVYWGLAGWSVICMSDEEMEDRLKRATKPIRFGQFRTMLSQVRLGWEALSRERAAEAEAEFQAENAWLRHAELPTFSDMQDEDRERELEFWFGDPTGPGQDWDCNGGRDL